jgi:hypothetical protein
MKPSENAKRLRENLLAQYISRANGLLYLGAHLGQEATKYEKCNKPVIWVEAIRDVVQINSGCWPLGINISREPILLQLSRIIQNFHYHRRACLQICFGGCLL